MDEILGVNLTIDGKEISVPQGTMIIEAADDAQIHIPRFCYHKKLSIAANCRMCLIDLEGGRKPMPACATPVSDGMIVYTKNEKALSYQKAVMEFLLINHPLDCPICDQGGECELQDVAMGHGKDTSRYTQDKRAVEDYGLGPLISTDLTRCIHCTRCVRFGEEISGHRELGMTGRGEFSRIETFLNTNVDSEVSANVIDLCPVGALTNKPFRFHARAWELSQHAFVSPHDCLGSNSYAHVRRNKFLRVVPRENESINEVWISDRDRFSYQGIYAADRAQKPLIKRGSDWEDVSWEKAFENAVGLLQKQLSKKGADALCVLGTSQATVEESYLLQKLSREVGSDNIDFRQRQTDFSNQDSLGVYPGLNCEISEMDNADAVFVIGSNMRSEQPIMHLKLRKAWYQNEAKVCVLNPADFDFRLDLAENLLVNIDQLPQVLAEVVCVILKSSKSGSDIKKQFSAEFADIKPSKDAKNIAKILMDSDNPMILSGALAANHPDASLILNLQNLLIKLLNAKGGRLSQGPNAAGASLAGLLPHLSAAGKILKKSGLNADQMLQDADKKVFILFNTDPVHDSRYGKEIAKALHKATVIAITPYASESIKQYADVILPMGSFAESSGTYVNASGVWQSFRAILKPEGLVRPGWKILRVLANFLKLDGFDYESSDQVKSELLNLIDKKHSDKNKSNKPVEIKLAKIKVKEQKQCKAVYNSAVYAQDSLVLRAESLQNTNLTKNHNKVKISKAKADKLGVKAGDMVNLSMDKCDIKLPVYVDSSLPDLNIVFPVGFSKTSSWVCDNKSISIKKVK